MVTFTATQRQALRLHAASAILTGHNAAWASLRNGSTTHYEPVFVAHLCASLSHLATPWSAELRQIDANARLSISSVFTHQRPYVTFASGALTETCELSDVMIALIDRTDPANIQSRCIFVQAKRDDFQTVELIQKNDLKQLYLYTNRPTFDVNRKFAPKSISFPEVPSDTGLNYGITPPTNIMANSTPVAWGSDRWKLANNLKNYGSTTISASISLQDLLVDFLEGSAGFNFMLSLPGEDWSILDSSGDKWSALINFILQDAISAKSPRYASGFWSRRSDGERALTFSMLDSCGVPYVTLNELLPLNTQNRLSDRSTLVDEFLANFRLRSDPPEIIPPDDDGNRDDGQWGGMSVVLMEVSIRND